MKTLQSYAHPDVRKARELQYNKAPICNAKWIARQIKIIYTAMKFRKEVKGPTDTWMDAMPEHLDKPSGGHAVVSAVLG